jgi:hypothetical protein
MTGRSLLQVSIIREWTLDYRNDLAFDEVHSPPTMIFLIGSASNAVSYGVLMWRCGMQ